jgi:hypothetical protein
MTDVAVQTDGPPAHLPPAITRPVSDAEAELGRMGRATARLARELIAGRDVYMVVRTRTKVDVGSWLARGRVWLVVLADSLVVAATAPGAAAPMAEEVPFGKLRGSRYNHVTGQLAPPPAAIPGAKGLAMGPVEGAQVLAQIHHMR